MGDPIAAYGKKRVEFHLPVRIPTLLFQGLHMKVWGSTFPGLFGDQWLERILVLSKTDNKVIEIVIKDDLHNFNKDLQNPGEFETLKVAMWTPERTELQTMPPLHNSWDVDNLVITFGAQHWGEEARKHRGAPRRECVSIASVTSKLAVCSSSAHEYFGNGIGAWEFAHLDINFANVTAETTSSLKGVLPELWGLVPVSNRTKSFIQKEWVEESDINLLAEGHGTVDLNLTQFPAQFFAQPKETDVRATV